MDEIEEFVSQELSKYLSKNSDAANVRFSLSFNEKLVSMFERLCSSIFWEAYNLGYDKAKLENAKKNWEEWNQK